MRRGLRLEDAEPVSSHVNQDPEALAAQGPSEKRSLTKKGTQNVNVNVSKSELLRSNFCVWLSVIY